MEGCIPNTIKYLLFATNFLVFVMAFVVCGFGVFALVDGQSFTDLLEKVDDDSSINLYTSAAVILIAVSILVIIITFFGCCGAIKENRCMLGTYFVIVLAMFIVMIVGAIIGVTQSMEKLKDPLRESIERYDPNSQESGTEALTKAWDKVQEDFKCCGVDEFSDWSQNSGFLNTVPISCCQNSDEIDNAETCSQNPGNYADHLPGCFTKLEDYLDDNSNKLLAVAVVIVIIMFLNMIFAFAMCTMAQ